MSKRTLPLILLFGFLPHLGWSEAGRTAGTTLTRIHGARPTGLGNAYVAMDEDLQSLSYNPASVARLKHAEISSTYLDGFAEDNSASIIYSHPLSVGSLYMGGIYFDAGDIELNLSNGTQETRTAQQDVVGMAGLSLGKKGPFSAGVNLKYYRFELAEEAHAAGLAYDAGLFSKTPLKNFNLGASIRNLGADVKFEQESDPLSTTGQVGAKYHFNIAKAKILLLADGSKAKDEKTRTHAGLEISHPLEFSNFYGSAALRAGYISEPRVGTFGLGIYLGRLLIDYSINLFDRLDPTQRISLGFVFSKKTESKEEGSHTLSEYERIQMKRWNKK